MDSPAQKVYINQLNEIKRRGAIYQALQSATTNLFYAEASVEVEALQLRRILELMAFGFVLATGEKAIPAYASFARYKDTIKFFAALRSLNEKFYPQPIVQIHKDDDSVQWDHPQPSEFLTKDDFHELFKHCESILEPYRVGAPQLVLEQCRKANHRWYAKIVRLLNAHLVEESGGDVCFLFQMGHAEQEPSATVFQAKALDGTPLSQDRETEPPLIFTLENHLHRQLDYLSRSCEIYDAGYQDEAIRLAVAIRTLVHDTPKSQSLLHLLDAKQKIRLPTSWGLAQRLPKNFTPTAVFPVFGISAEGGTHVPFPLPEPLIYVSVDEWWDEVVWMQDTPLSRKQIVLNTANKEGGAHVDVKVPKAVSELRTGLAQLVSVKVNGVEVGSPSNYHFLLLRQFAYELLNSSSLTGLASAVHK